MAIRDKLNPVFLREVRRFVRNGVALAMLNIFLVVLLTAGLFALYAVLSGGEKLDADDCYRFFGWVFGGVAVIVIPIMVFARHSANVRVESPDLLLSTDIRPRQVVDGMAQTGIVGMLLALSVTFPVLMLTYLISNIDLLTTLTQTCLFAGISVAAIYYAVACGSMRLSAPLRIKAFILGLPVFALLAFIIAVEGPPILPNEPEVIEMIFAGVIVTVLCSRLVAEGALSPISVNRYAPLHRSVSVIWILSFVLLFVVPKIPGLKWNYIDYRGFIDVWAFLWTLAFGVLLLVSSCSASLSPLYLRKSGGKGWLPVRVFFDGGAEHGMALWLLLVCISNLIAGGVCDRYHSYGPGDFNVFFAGAFSFSAVTARFIWRIALEKRFPHPAGWVSMISFLIGILVIVFTILSLSLGHGVDKDMVVGGTVLLFFAIVLFIPVYMMGCASPVPEETEKNAVEG